MARYRRSAASKKVSQVDVLNYHKYRKVNSRTLSEHGRYMRSCKAAKHAHVTQRYTGHFTFMNLCKRYTKLLRHKLTPAELSHIRVTHKDEIAASSVGQPWPKKPKTNLVTEESSTS